MSETIPDVDPIEYEVLQDVSPGEDIAVQVRPLTRGRSDAPAEPPVAGSYNPPWYVFAGEVRDTEDWTGGVDPTDLVVDGDDISEHTSLASISVDPHLLWQITADAIQDDSRKVTNVPPVRSSSTAPNDGPPPCLLSYRPDRHTHLVVHEAYADGSEIWHASRSLGSVVRVVHGPVVKAEQVVPPGYEAPP